MYLRDAIIATRRHLLCFDSSCVCYIIPSGVSASRQFDVTHWHIACQAFEGHCKLLGWWWFTCCPFTLSRLPSRWLVMLCSHGTHVSRSDDIWPYHLWILIVALAIISKQWYAHSFSSKLSFPHRLLVHHMATLAVDNLYINCSRWRIVNMSPVHTSQGVT